MAEQWFSLEGMFGGDKVSDLSLSDLVTGRQPSQTPVVSNPDAAFIASMPRANKLAQTPTPIPLSSKPANPDQAFIAEMPKAPDLVFMDPEKVKKAKIISSTLAMPFGPIFDNVDAASAAFDQHDPGWFKESGRSIARAVANQMITAARAAEWAGIPKSLTGDLYESGTRMRDAYLPSMKPEEFDFMKPLDPRWWATTAVEGVTSSLMLVPAAVVGAYGATAAVPAGIATAIGTFGMTVIGALGATAVSRPIESAFEAAQSYDEAKAQGLNDAEAKARGNFVFNRNMVAGGVLDVGELVTAFTPLKLLGGAANKTLTRRIIATIGKFGTAAAMEGGEEAYQEGIQQMARGERMHVSPEMKEAAALGAIMGVGMGGAGSVWHALTGRMENKMSPKLKEEFKAHEVAATVLGKTPEEAKIIALDKFAETPAGKAHVEKVMGEMKDIVDGKEIPLTQADMDKAITEAGEEKPFTMGGELDTEPAIEAAPEPDPLAGILTDEDIKAIGEGTGTIESALGMEQPDVAMTKEALPGMSDADVMPDYTGWTVDELQHRMEVIKEKGSKNDQKEIPLLEKAIKQVESGKNILVSEESYQTALKSLKEKTTGFHAGIDPTALADLVKIGAYHLERGVRNFADWSKLMVDRFGKAIEKHLPDIWAQSKDLIKRGVPSMVDLGEDTKAQVEAVTGEAQPAGEVKKQIRRTTGQETVVKMIREDDALYAAFKKAEQSAAAAYKAGGKDALVKAKAEFNDVMMKAKAKAEMFGFKEGFKVAEKITRKEFIAAFQEQQAMTKATQKMMIEYIKENLPREVQGKFLDAIISQVSEHKALSVMSQVDALEEKLTRRQLINEIKNLQEFKGQHIAVDYQKKINDLLGDIDTKQISAKTLAKLEGLIKYAEDEGMPSGINRTMRDNLARLSQKNVTDMTTEDLKSLVDMANHLKELGQLKQQLKYKYNQREREKAKAALVKSTVNLDPKLSTAGNTMADKSKKAATYATMESLTGWRVPEKLDGYLEGENVRHYKNLWTAEQAAKWDKHTALNDAVEEIQKLGIDTISEKDNIEIMINIRNQEGADAATLALMEKYGYNEIPEMTRAQQGLIDILKKYSGADVDKIAALYEETKNEPFVKLENRILPLKYEGAFYLSAEEAILEDHHRTTQTQQGFTQARKPGVKKIPRVDVMAVFDLGLDEQKWYIHMQPAIDNVARLVKTKEYVEAAGESGANWWKDHLEILARRGWSASAQYSWGGDFLKAARGNLTKAILGYKLSTIIMQPLAVIDAMSYARGRWGGTAALEILNQFTQAWIVPGRAKAAIEASQKLQLRAGTAGEVAIQELGAKQSKFTKSAMAMMTKADLRTAAGVEKGLQNILEKYGVPNAQHEAGQLMDMVSSSSDVSFRPHILARGEMARTWFTFGTFALNRWAIISHDLAAKGIVKGDWKARYSAAMGLGIIIAGTIAENEARKYLYEMISGKEKKRRSIFIDAMFALPQNIPIFGDIFGPFTGGSGTDIPLIKVGSDLLGAGTAIAKQKPHAKAKAILKSVEAGATIFAGKPGTAQAFDLIERILLPESKSSGSGRVELGPQK